MLRLQWNRHRACVQGMPVPQGTSSETVEMQVTESVVQVVEALGAPIAWERCGGVASVWQL
jgi:hypothetical protein